MHKLHSLKDKLLKELNEYADRTSYGHDDIATIRNLISSINKICEYTDAEEGKEEYSGRMSHRYLGYPYAYDEEGSYARGRRGNVKRDAMGRYSRDDEMMAKLYEVMEDAPEHKKQEIKRMIEKLERM